MFRDLKAHKFTEGLSEFGVEDGVNDGIDETVHVTEPRGDNEGRYTWLTGHRQLVAHCVHDVAREEWYPANQEGPCNRYQKREKKRDKVQTRWRSKETKENK